MLYFSDTVCVLTFSSSLPALEGALESSKGFTPYILLSRPSELQLVLLDEPSTGEPGTESSSRKRCVLDLDGGSREVADSAGPLLYSRCSEGFCRIGGAVGGL